MADRDGGPSLRTPLIANPPNIVHHPAPYLAFSPEAAWWWPLKAGDEWGIAAGSQAPWVAEELCRPTKLLKTVQCGSHLFWCISEEKRMPPLSPWYEHFPKIAIINEYWVLTKHKQCLPQPLKGRV